jgi:uncharacterized protein YxeA
MIVALNNHFSFLRIAISLLLVIIMSLKITSAIFTATPHTKQIYSLIKINATGEKKAENDNQSEKDQEFAIIHRDISCYVTPYTTIIHYTAYRSNYHPSYHHKIKIPPPDLSLQTSV